MICSCFFSNDFSASLIKFSVSFGIVFVVECSSFDPKIFKIKSPFETLSPTLTFIVSIMPDNVEGISTLDLSLSIVTTGSFLAIFWPSLTSNSMTSTFSKSPISGTNSFSLI